MRLVLTSVPGMRLRLVDRHHYEAVWSFKPTEEERWAIAKALPDIVRKAIAQHKAHLAHMSKLHRSYHLKRRHW